MKKTELKQSNDTRPLIATYSGPIPSAAELANYERIHPGFAERIIVMAESQGEHRRKMEQLALEANIEMAGKDFAEGKRGQIFAFIIAFTALIISGLLIGYGKYWGGALLGSATLAVIVCAFINGRSKENKSMLNKE